MGRKIPGKKHRGVKDPEKQQQKRDAELKDKINKPPANPDDQPMPKGVLRIIELKEKMKNQPVFKKKKRKRGKLISLEPSSQPKLHPKARPEKTVPIFKQRPNESGERFMNRVNRETDEFLKETAFEKKFKVEVKRNPKTGKVIGIQKAHKDELDEMVKLKSKHKNIGKKKNSTFEHLSKSQKRKKKLLAKKEKKEDNEMSDGLIVREQIKFGEIVQEPPKLPLPRKATKENSAKIGKKDLLLHKVLEQNSNKKVPSKVTKAKVINKSGKRKDLPIAERRKLEKQQSEVIAAYRALKAKS